MDANDFASLNVSATANPYAEDPSALVFPLSGIVRVEGEILYCRQNADLRGYCFFTGKPCSEVRLDHRFAQPVMPQWIWRWRWNCICIGYIVISFVAVFVSVEAACLCCLFRLVLDVPMLFFPKFRARTSIVDYPGFNMRLGNQRRNLVALIGLLPLVVMMFIFVGKAFRFGLPGPAFTLFDAKTIVFLAAIVCTTISEAFTVMLRVSEVDEDLYTIEGLAPELVASIRAELSDSHHPYTPPAANECRKPSRNWKPNTELSNWSLGLIVFFLVMDGPFVLFTRFRDTPWQYVFYSLIIDAVILAPITLMLFVDGFRAVRAAPIRMFIITVFTLFHIWMVLLG